MLCSSVLALPLLAMAAPADPNASPWLSLLPFVVILGIFYVMVLMPMKKRQQKVAQFQGSLKIGDKVITTGGLYGSITRLGDQSLQLQVADKIRVEIARSAVVGFQGQEPVAGEGQAQ